MKAGSAFAAVADRLRFTLVAIGWPGVVGLLLLVVGAVGQFILVPQQEAQAANARSEAERRHDDYLRIAGGGQSGRDDAAATLARFRERLTSEKEADGILETIQRDAQKNGLAPAGTEYKWQRQPDAKLAEVRIVMPLKAGYAPLRAFVSDVLTDVPGLALDQFDLQRDNIGAAVVDARLRFSLFLKAGS